MQVLLMPAKNERAAAEALEAPELHSNLGLATTLLVQGSELYEGYEQWIAYYGMTCAKILRDKGYQAPDVSDMMHYRPDSSIRPRWHQRFIKQHRGYLVLLGWVRYFNERGATGMDLVKQSTDPQDLLSRFVVLDSWLNDNEYPPATRAYAHFEELPAAYVLHP